MNKVIITGANGFVGRHLVKSFVSSGYEVVAVVRNEDSDVSVLKDIKNTRIVYCGLDGIEKLPELVPEGADIFLHFAWEGTSGNARADYALQFGNVIGSCKAVEAAKQAGCKRFVFAGSIMAYEAKEYVLSNGAVPTPSYVYSIAKLSAEMAAKTSAIRTGIEFIDVVISNIYGVGERSERFLNNLVRKILSGEKLKLTECTQTYDFIYVDDAADAIRIAAINGETLSSYYIGNTEQYPLKKFVLEATEILNAASDIEFGAVPFCGARFDYSEVLDTKSLSKLGFSAKTSFKDGVRLLADDIRRSYL